MTLLSPNHPQRDWTSLSTKFPIWKLEVNRPFCSAAEFLDYLIKFSDFFDLNIQTHCAVKTIRKVGEYFEVVTTKETFQAKIVLVATGFFGNPFIPEIQGMRNNPCVVHSHYYQKADDFRKQRVIVIGAGNSAAEIAIELSGFSQVYLIARNELQFFSKTNNLCHVRGLSESLLLELIKLELIHYIPNSIIHKIDGNELYYNEEKLHFHNIICATGYRPVLNSLNQFHIETDPKSKFPTVTMNGESSTVKNLFFAGPLAFTKLGSLFIHGFISVIPKTILKIKEILH